MNRSNNIVSKLRGFTAVICLISALSACGNDAGNGSGSAPPAGADNGAPAQTSSRDNSVSTDGTIEAVIDGEARAWYVTSGEYEGQRQSQSDWRSFGPTMASVSLLGHTTDNNLMATKDAFLIGFTLHGIGGTLSVSSPEISFLSGGLMNRHTSNDIDDPAITITSAEIDGETLTISGTFSGAIQFQSITGSGAPADGKTDMNVTDGTFQTVIMAEIDP